MEMSLPSAARGQKEGAAEGAGGIKSATLAARRPKRLTGQEVKRRGPLKDRPVPFFPATSSLKLQLHVLCVIKLHLYQRQITEGKIFGLTDCVRKRP